MSHSHDSEPQFEKLSKAITEAVMTSEKVRKVVEEIQKKDEICTKRNSMLYKPYSSGLSKRRKIMTEKNPRIPGIIFVKL